MEKKEILAIFNSQFKEFVNDISHVFPNNKDIVMFNLAIPQILLLSPSKVYKAFKKFVVSPYHNEIDSGDINFFINKDYKNDLSLTGGTSDAILEKIDCLREPIKNMTMDEQAKVIKYMQNMRKLCDLYESSK